MLIDYKQIPDGELLALLKAQDELAFAEIYDSLFDVNVLQGQSNAEI